MKKQSKSKLITSLQSLSIVLVMFFAMAFDCNNGESHSGETQNDLPSLPGTAWKMDFGKGVTGTVFLFCKSGRWEIVPARVGSIGAMGKSYSVSGSTLTTVNADDGRVEKYKMTWKDNVLELDDGKVILKLHYNGETQC